MDRGEVSADYIIAKLIDMGFEFSKASEAVELVGPSLDRAVEFILSGSSKSDNKGNLQALSSSRSQIFDQGYAPSYTSNRRKQSSIKDHLHPLHRIKGNVSSNSSFSSTYGRSSLKCKELDQQDISNIDTTLKVDFPSEYSQQVTENGVNSTALVSQEKCNSQSHSLHNQEVKLEWEQKVGDILHKHFGFSSLKGFQKKALDAWLANRDCLVLAATGSGKSLCFQIPAIMTSKVVIVISPLISLMHDQCLKLAKYGVSACFLGSGQSDNSVEHKAMCGAYKIVYVCPETILRLVEPLKGLAVNPGITLFAIDEAHCVSKWGHDFRPDYRRLSVLRENFTQFNIPLMALTATATNPVREDILKSLHMSKETEIILTSFFRPNLRFSVKHSRTSSVCSYRKDFKELIQAYTATRMANIRKQKASAIDNDNSDTNSSDYVKSAGEETSLSNSEDDEGGSTYKNWEVNGSNDYASLEKIQLTVEYLEDELDIPSFSDDFDVSCGEFPSIESENLKTFDTSKSFDMQVSLEEGPTIIYVPTRKETLRIADYLCKFNVKAAAYHAKLPKSHLRHVHHEFHQGSIQVVVATIAFGMGIDKSNVRRIIHYGWPQSLEAYYQEAGRAGRDGKLSDCTLYSNLSRIPTLLPSQRNDEQTKQAYKLLSDCFRYAMNTTTCRAKALVGYFGEELDCDGCHLCDICVAGPPEIQNMKAEADVFLGVLKAEHAYAHNAYTDDTANKMVAGRPNFRMVVSRIREQFRKFATSDPVWWRGLARILEEKGYITEGDVLVRVSIKYPELTEQGLRFLRSESEKEFLAYPEADMLLSSKADKPYSSFSEWGRGWADPEIRRQRLEGKKYRKRKRRPARRKNPEPNTVRGRLSAKLSKKRIN
ncbi:ATP-dependent DNA helicase Q-like SIM isoform X1 [Zingiber officinale]|uniref:ATP-dependent DNA helicase Q-like SIM isoform X1 n=1 Tax=Zingiber officinale TaxID=94328 RepID=UPI001C4C41F0|nr:ATP-dependent DNA helicase Q-like SIM isoform X1 [Zingiber officinale]